MPTAPLHVLIVGGGIGGLCLAQGLKRAGVSVAVYERDRDRTDRREGYRLNINPAGSRALHTCLPPAVWDAFVATAGDSSGGFRFMTERLETLAIVDQSSRWGTDDDPAESQYPVDRVTLRGLLLTGLDDEVHFDKRFARFEQSPDGPVTAYFADGDTATGDVLVGADGASSRICKQLLPQARQIETDAIGIGLKLPLTDRTRAWLPPQLATGSTMILTPDPFFLFTSAFKRKPGWAAKLDAIGNRAGVAGLRPELLVDTGQAYQEYVLCAFNARRDVFPHDVHDLDGHGLHGVVEHLIGTWHPTLRQTISEADPETAMLVPLKASTPLEPWDSTNVTVLGDAIHRMPPVGGLGGNTALRDAQLLARQLAAVDRGDRSLVPAIAEYEAEMRAYGFDAVRAALRETQQGISSNRFTVTAFKAALRLASDVPPLKHVVLGNAGAVQARPRPWELRPARLDGGRHLAAGAASHGHHGLEVIHTA
jgi:2-polyprenyl-6-methoxyphenol hydroxylase-like FAD-dependent oxidoreductase